MRRRRFRPSWPTQVLGALHELLRGLHAADRRARCALAREQPRASLRGAAHRPDAAGVPALRRGSRPASRRAPTRRARAFYEQGYGVRALHARLAGGRGAATRTRWTSGAAPGARLLALFRLVHGGDRTGWIRGRGGKLFDPAAFPFLQGQDAAERPARACRRLRRLRAARARRAADAGRRAAVLPHARRRADRLGLRDGDGLHGRDRARAVARHPGGQEQPHAGLRRSGGAGGEEAARTG